MIITSNRNFIADFDEHISLVTYDSVFASMVINSTAIFIKNNGDFLSKRSKMIFFIFLILFELFTFGNFTLKNREIKKQKGHYFEVWKMQY